MVVRIAVVGGGIIGISTAQALVEDHQNIEVTVYSEIFTPFTTGDVSAGFIYPYLFWENDIDDIAEWTKATVEHLAELHLKGDHVATGISPISAYLVAKSEPMDRRTIQMFDGVREVSQDELRRLTNVRYSEGYFMTTWSCDCKVYLPYIMSNLLKNGVKFVTEKINSLENLAARGYDIVVNCTGYGASDLTNDSSLQPIQGQVLTVKAPWFKHAFAEDDGDVYVLPCMDVVVVGGSHDKSASLNPDKALTKKIWSQACKVFPSLQHAQILETKVGLRPGRPKIRMGSEHKKTKDGRKYIIFHHYGHGGSGVTIHWGCAKRVSSMLRAYISLKANL